MADTLSVNGIFYNGSGDYSVQAIGNNLAVWTDLDTEVGEVTDGVVAFPTITIDPMVLLSGEDYQISVLDNTTAFRSNIVIATIP